MDSLPLKRGGKGFTVVMKGAGISLLIFPSANFDQATASMVMEELLKEYLSAQAIFAQNDAMIFGAVLAIKNVGIKNEVIM